MNLIETLQVAFHNNAHPLALAHSAEITDNTKYEIHQYPLCSPGITPFDFCVFGLLDDEAHYEDGNSPVMIK
jgi:hypothetical protein